jgi:hypothetical protein
LSKGDRAKVFLDAFELTVAYVTDVPPPGDTGNAFDYRSQTIYWDPTLGLINPRDATQTLSPAMGLMHEMGHELSYLYNKEAYIKRRATPAACPQNRNAEEDRNLRFERKIAHDLGEWERPFYDSGEYIRFSSPVKR